MQISVNSNNREIIKRLLMLPNYL